MRTFREIANPLWKAIAELYLLTTRFFMSLRQTGRLVPGCLANWNGHECTVVSCETPYTWLVKLRDSEVCCRVDAEDLSFIWDWDNIRYSALYWFNWYRGCWYDVDISSLTDIDYRPSIASVRVLGKRIAHGKDYS